LKDFSADRNSAKISNEKSKFFAPLAQLAEQVTLNHGRSEAIRAVLPNTLPNFQGDGRAFIAKQALLHAST
jgi:hypothetical protein